MAWLLSWPGESPRSADTGAEEDMVSENEATAAPELEAAVAQMPFAAALGMVLDAAGADEVRGRLAWAPERCTTAGTMHGGALMALADSLGGLCAFLNLPAGAGTATISSSTVFTRAVREGEVIAVTRPLHVGRSTVVVQTDLADQAGRRVAQVTQVQAVPGGDRGR